MTVWTTFEHREGSRPKLLQGPHRLHDTAEITEILEPLEPVSFGATLTFGSVEQIDLAVPCESEVDLDMEVEAVG